MDIVVHGTKGGRQIFTQNKLGGLLDVNSDASKASALGHEAFAIRFIENSIIFSKYKIIRDVRGDKRTGFLGFSLFLNNNERLTGSELISVLNKVSAEYCNTYIPENDNNLKSVKEDWFFLECILNEYKGRLREVDSDDIKKLVSGTKDDAYIYFKNDEELEKYLDSPYNSHYSPYRQVLFIQEKLRDKPENPLNALRHSVNPNDNLTEKIDLNEITYSLRDYIGQAIDGTKIEIKVKGQLLYNKNDKITNKDIISIRYYKKHYEEIRVPEGKLNDEWIKKYLTVDQVNRKIDVVKNNSLTPFKKTINFKVKDWQEKDIFNDTTIICHDANGNSHPLISNQAIFVGEQIAKTWYISANYNRFSSDKKPINFEYDCPGENGSIDIFLTNHKLEENQIKVIDENGDIFLKKFSLSKKEFNKKEIPLTNKITLSSDGYESQTFPYCPATSSYPEPIKLKRNNWTKFNSTRENLGAQDENIPTSNKNEPKRIDIIDHNNKTILLSVIAVIIIVLGIIVFTYWDDFQSYFKVDNVNQNTSPASEPKIPSDSGVKKEADTGSTRKPVSETIKGQNAEKSKGSETKDEKGKKTENVEPKHKTKTGNEEVLPTPNPDIIDDIAQKLKTDKVTKNDLEKWEKSGNGKIKKAVNLYLKFWGIFKSDQKEDFQKLLDEIKKDDILKNSELSIFLNIICIKSSDDFEKLKNTKGKATCKTLADLKSKME